MTKLEGMTTDYTITFSSSLLEWEIHGSEPPGEQKWVRVDLDAQSEEQAAEAARPIGAQRWRDEFGEPMPSDVFVEVKTTEPS